MPGLKLLGKRLLKLVNLILRIYLISQVQVTQLLNMKFLLKNTKIKQTIMSVRVIKDQ